MFVLLHDSGNSCGTLLQKVGKIIGIISQEKTLFTVTVVRKNLTKRITGFEVLRVVVMKIYVFWDITKCSDVSENDGGDMFLSKCRLTLNGLRGVMSQKTVSCRAKCLYPL